MQFKVCTMCGKTFSNRDEFLRSGMVLIGYMANFDHPDRGLFLFNHNCKTTLAIPVREFLDLYSGPRYRERKIEDEDCPRHCLNVNDLFPLPQPVRFCLREKSDADIEGLRVRRIRGRWVLTIWKPAAWKIAGRELQ